MKAVRKSIKMVMGNGKNCGQIQQVKYTKKKKIRAKIYVTYFFYFAKGSICKTTIK